MASSKENQGKFIGKIDNGPSRWELGLALFDNRPRPISFTLRDEHPEISGKRIKVHVSRIGKQAQESGREKWIVDGLILGTSIVFTAVYFPQTRYGEIFQSEDWRGKS